ncbi:MAG: hypothetical protein QNK23_10820 [Crocinitomicaceae bacterium]|nr:hypothetical protein [Crocinitomicaceae bacterium]
MARITLLFFICCLSYMGLAQHYYIDSREGRDTMYHYQTGQDSVEYHAMTRGRLLRTEYFSNGVLRNISKYTKYGYDEKKGYHHVKVVTREWDESGKKIIRERVNYRYTGGRNKYVIWTYRKYGRSTLKLEYKGWD